MKGLLVLIFLPLSLLVPIPIFLRTNFVFALISFVLIVGSWVLWGYWEDNKDYYKLKREWKDTPENRKRKGYE